MTLANTITIFRIFTVPVFIATVLYYSPAQDYLRWAALGIFVLAVISDFVDGYIARRFRQKTPAGAILDPLADKLLVISAFLCLYKLGSAFEVIRFPIWLVVALISRDIILIAGAMLIFLVRGRMAVEPTLPGKATMVLQSLTIIGMLGQWPWSMWLWYPVIVFAGVSCIDYIGKGVKIINSNPSGELKQ